MEFSFILISKSEKNLEKSVEALKCIIQKYNIHSEIICSIGNNPSTQRNEAAKVAKGAWLYFLDDDSILDPDSHKQFRLALEKFSEAMVFGGPSLLCHEDKSNWQEAIQLVFCSDFGVGPIKSRYLSIGVVRESSEKELILCNMIINKDFFLQNGGFNEALYPNEENEFLSRIDKKGQMIYSPLIIVYRRHRKNLKSFFLQMVHYGKGRTKHLLFSSDYSDYVYFLPLAIILLAVVPTLFTARPIFLFYIFSAYLFLILPTCLINLFYKRSIITFLMSLLAFCICHLGYSLGLLLGFIKKAPVPNKEVKISFYLNGIDRNNLNLDLKMVQTAGVEPATT